MGLQFLARLPKGVDLLEAITNEFKSRSIRAGSFNLIGALTKVVIGFYHSDKQQYSFTELNEDFEIVSCIGNISEKDGEIFTHAHILVSDKNLNCFGGHLAPGSIIFASELWGTEVPGSIMKREFDEATGLALWSKK